MLDLRCICTGEPGYEEESRCRSVSAASSFNRIAKRQIGREKQSGMSSARLMRRYPFGRERHEVHVAEGLPESVLGRLGH